MIIIGVSAIRVEATPALVYWTAISEKPTPTKGPKMVVRVAAVMLVRSVRFLASDLYPSLNLMRMRKPMIPATQRKKLAKNGSIHGADGVVIEAS